MLEIKVIEKESDFVTTGRTQFVDFLHKHLGEYGDPVSQINMSIDHAFSENEAKGGFLLAAFKGEQLVGGLVMNCTGMSGYIPENILVYVAVDASFRGEGIGRKIVEKALSHAQGDVKLHVEYDNPAKRLYERIGFTTKYADMRFTK